MKDIEELVTRFRTAIEAAMEAGEFIDDISFRHFPRGCCGDTCDLLGQFLLDSGIQSYYICGVYSDEIPENTQNHAWILINKRIIVDITGDQFKYNSALMRYNRSIYVGPRNKFYDMFDIVEGQCHDNQGLKGLYGTGSYKRMYGLYGKIMKYLYEI